MVKRRPNLLYGGALMEVYAGLDLHSTNTYVAMIDKENTVLYKQRHKNEMSAILSALDPFKKDIQGVVVESTYKLVLVGGRPHGRRLPGSSGQCQRHQAI
jgi:hypothetical protein